MKRIWSVLLAPGLLVCVVAEVAAQPDGLSTIGDRVQAGAYLGDEGDVGCAARSHLHFEEAVPRNPADPIIPTGGSIKGENRIPRICDLPGQVAHKGNQYVAAPCRE